MKRLRAILLHGMLALSLLLCLVAAAVWVRSYWRCDTVAGGWSYVVDPPRSRNVVGGAVSIRISSNRGRVWIRWRDSETTWRLEPYRWAHYEAEETFRYDDAPGILGWLGFQGSSDSDPTREGVRSHALHVPLWSIMLATAAVPVWWIRRVLLRRRRVARGLCPACGYDLRASPQRCPECGGDPRPDDRQHARDSPAYPV